MYWNPIPHIWKTDGYPIRLTDQYRLYKHDPNFDLMCLLTCASILFFLEIFCLRERGKLCLFFVCACVSQEREKFPALVELLYCIIGKSWILCIQDLEFLQTKDIASLICMMFMIVYVWSYFHALNWCRCWYMEMVHLTSYNDLNKKIF